MKAREFWIAKGYGCPDVVCETWPGKYAHQYLHVREVIPGQVMISGEMLWKLRQEIRHWSDCPFDRGADCDCEWRELFAPDDSCAAEQKK